MTLMLYRKKVENCRGIRKLKHVKIKKEDKEVM
jgi:hypothetical protein